MHNAAESMKQSKKTGLFTIYLLLFVSLRTNAELPSIRPVPCTNHMTGENGICTFNWSCVNVAHGVHIGACVDRFFIGTCCKIPSDSESSTARPPADDATQTTRGVDQVAPALHHTLAAEAEEEKVKITVSPINIGHVNLTFNPLDYPGVAYNATSITDSNREPEIVFDHVLNSTQETGNWEHSPSLSPIKNILSGSFFQTLFFPAHRNNNGASAEKSELTTATYEILSESSPVKRPTSVVGPTSHTFTLADTWKQRTTESYHDLRKPVSLHDTHNERKPVLQSEQHDLRRPVIQSNQHDLRRPVPLDEAHDQRWPVLEEDSHDLRWPVLEEDSHNERLPIVNYFQQGNTNVDKSQYEITTPITKYSYSTSESTDANSSTEPSQNLFSSTNRDNSYSEQTIPPLSFTTSDQKTKDNVNSFNTISPDFALFIRPTYFWPSLKPQSPFLEKIPTSTPEPNLKDVSRICGRSRGTSTTGRIVGGRKSHNLRWPWMISLRRFEGKTYKHKCGAALLNQFWAITAAHCVDGKLPMDVTLRLGEYNFGRFDELHPHVERRVYVMVIHPDFDHITYENDLALLRFHEPIELQANIIPICLPHSMDDITGRMAVVTGWGRLSEEGELPASLHEVQLPILSNEECEKMYYEAGYSENIRDIFVCAGVSGGGLDACEGDSGGPMIVRGDNGQWVLVGLISWGMGCAAPKQPGVYTRISKFTDWIDGIISH